MAFSQTLLPEFDEEMKNTRKLLECVPDDKFDYQPHAKSMKLGRLATHVAEIPGKVGENLRLGLATLELSRRLATIRTDLDLPLSLAELKPGAADTPKLRELYTRFELRAQLRALEGSEGTAPVIQSSAALPTSPPLADTAAGAVPASAPDRIERRYETVTRWEDLERWLAALTDAELFAFDTETTSLDYMRAEIVGVSFAVEPGFAAYVPLAHVYPGAPDQLDRARVLAALKPLLESEAHGKVGHNLKYDAHVLLNAGIALAARRSFPDHHRYTRAQAKARFDRPAIFGRRCPHAIDACKARAERRSWLAARDYRVLSVTVDAVDADVGTVLDGLAGALDLGAPVP